MGSIRNLWLTAVLIALSTNAASGQAASRKAEIEKFNNRLRELHLKMDTAGIFTLWADDGVELMPGEAPIIGKKVIQAWVEDILSKMAGYNVTKEEMEFHDIQVSGDWASEWGLEHQVVQPPDGKEPIETWGKIALVLHREANGEWRIKQEMWNAAPQLKPAAISINPTNLNQICVGEFVGERRRVGLDTRQNSAPMRWSLCSFRGLRYAPSLLPSRGALRVLDDRALGARGELLFRVCLLRGA